MTIDFQNLPDSILESLSRIKYIHPEEIPDIPLYMDQLITFMDREMTSTKRHPDDKVLTKAMINNYVKNDLLPPPERKKYSKEHLLTLIFIYYLKNSLSIQDIESILHPLTERYWDAEGYPSLEEIYNAVFSLEEAEVQQLGESIEKTFALSRESIQSMDDMDPDEADYLEKFTFASLLSFDVYVKKLLVEKLIDSLQEPEKEENGD